MSYRWDVGYRYAAPLFAIALSLYGCTEQAAGPGRSIASIVVTPSLIVIDADTPFTAQAVVKDQFGEPFAQLPSRVKIVWSIQDPAIATVDQSGVITPLRTGTTHVIASIDYVLPQADLVSMGKGNGNTGGNGGGPKDSAGVHVQRVPTSFEVVSGDGQSAKVTTPLAQPLTIKALDRKGNIIAGAAVNFGVTQGGGSITPTSATTDASGLATASWTMGTMAGPAAAGATAAKGSASATFSAVALPGDAARMTVVAGDDQSAAPDSQLALPLKVQITDVMGNPVPGQAVKWQIASGGGAVSPGSTTTAADGTADSNWTLGSTSGQQEATASTTGVSATTFTAMASTTSLPDCITLASALDTLNYLGEIRQLTASVPAGSIVTWSSSNAGVASVDLFGKVTAVSKGLAVITAAVAGCAPATASVAVRQLAASVAVAPSSASLNTGDSKQLQATAADSGGTAITGLLFAWSSSDTAVARVDQTGLISARSAGTASVSAAAGAGAGTALITVTGPTPIPCVSVTPLADTLNYIGETTQLHDSVAANVSVTWTTSNAAVATVDSAGKVTAKGKGTASITATVSGCPSATVAISVRQVPKTVAVSPVTATLNVGQTKAFQATAKDSGGVAIAGVSFAWSSTTMAVATVDQSGLATAVTAGTSSIRAADGGVVGTAALTVSATVSADHAGFYVGPNGTASGDGSQSRPWDLQTALNGANGKIQPGDTVWLLGGYYQADYTETVSGTSSAPIVFRQYPGQRATVDGQWWVQGNYTWYWGFEIMYSDPDRTSTQTSSWPTDLPREKRQLMVYGTGTHVINMVLHDLAETYYDVTASDCVAYGNVIYNNGWIAPDRGHGHGLYFQGTGNVAEDNIIFDQFGKGIQAYRSDASLQNQTFRGNVSFNNGSLAGPNGDDNYLVGSDNNPTRNIDFEDNFSYVSPGTGGGNERFGYDGLGNTGGTIKGNYFAGGTWMVFGWNSLNVSGNTMAGSNSTILWLLRPSGASYSWNGDSYYAPASTAFAFNGGGYTLSGWRSATGYDGSSSFQQGKPTGTKVVVQVNAYEPGRANIVVYNWGGQASVTADLSGVLKAGQSYEIRNAEDYYAAPVASGTYGGGTVSLPMTGLSVAQPIGNAPYPGPATAPYFNVFVVLPTGQ